MYNLLKRTIFETPRWDIVQTEGNDKIIAYGEPVIYGDDLSETLHPRLTSQYSSLKELLDDIESAHLLMTFDDFPINLKENHPELFI